ncbi:uncharacterized protein DS421_8g237530 [Arachis hypogaea]|nr:uncharacterized protein DS421_8g237530 [Arachis hypogaea]
MVISFEMTQWGTQRRGKGQNSKRDGRCNNREENGHDGSVTERNAANREHDVVRVMAQ